MVDLLSQVPPAFCEGKVPLLLRFEGFEDAAHSYICYFEYRTREEKLKRKRSFCITDDNDDLIDKAFKSRLIDKLGFNGCPDYDLSLFGGENYSDTWSNYKDCLETNFSDQAVVEYLKKRLDNVPIETRKKILDSKDKHGFCFCHYFCFFGFHQSLEYLKENQASFEIKAKGWISPLHIAINGNDQRIVDLLLSHQTVIRNEDIGSKIDFRLIKDNKERIEKFLRKVSLNESLSNSAMSGLPSVDDYQSEDHEEEAFLKNIYSLLSNDHESEQLLHSLVQQPSRVKNSYAENTY